MAQPAALMLSGPDPRLGQDGDEKLGASGQSSLSYIRPQLRKLHDPTVKFEEYYYYANKTRALEDALTDEEASSATRGFISTIFPTKSGKGASNAERQGSVVAENVNLSDPAKRADISDEEWANASRALRTVSASAIFYLITTDILGPFGLPYAIATMGWGPGITLFTIFAVLAGYSGFLLWEIFLGLDSYEFPIKSYGDIGYRMFGNWCRLLFNFLQAAQLILNVGLIVISNGEALSQASKFRLCFAICCLVWALAGFLFGQIRTLQKFGWLANAAVWINLAVMGVTMAAAATTPPNYQGASQSAGASVNPASVTANTNGVYPSVKHYSNLPPSTDGFAGSVNGAMQAVFAYGGAMIFPEFMAEMRNPKKDWLKGMWAAQTFIYVVYMLYGLFMYNYEGQYTINPSYLAISKYSLQTAGNVLAMVSALIAAALYGNIGVKVLYNNIFVELFRAPPLSTRAGKTAWIGMIPIYWSIAFVIAAAIPDFSGLTGIVSATCILNFTYSLPPMLAVAFYIKKHSLQAGEGFDPISGQITLRDRGLKRWIRGFLSKRWYVNVFNVLYCLGALALCGLGSYASIENLINAFASGATNSFVCKSPLQG